MNQRGNAQKNSLHLCPELLGCVLTMLLGGCVQSEIFAPGCTTQRDCPADRVCDEVLGQCTSACEVHSECDATLICQDKKCTPFQRDCGESGVCVAGTFCRNGTCEKLRMRGSACSSSEQCETLHCADGVCCSSTCDGICESCLAVATNGVQGACEPVLLGLDPDDDCAGGLACNGHLACFGAVNGAVCSANFECQSNSCIMSYCVECGDSQLTANEACDDGSAQDERNGCSITCQRNDVCPNSRVESLFESCDDGNTLAGDGCSPSCQVEPGNIICEGNPSRCSRVYYVKAGASAGGSGTSWSSAFTDVASALSAASPVTLPVQVWVAQGTYRLTGPAHTFSLANGVALLGGFAGDEGQGSERNPQSYPTFLSGQVSPGIHAKHVVSSSAGIGPTAVLDGFTIVGGRAQDEDGGGMHLLGAPHIANTVVRDNSARRGGGVFVDGIATLLDVVLEDNFATEHGGGLYAKGEPDLERIAAEGNEALGDGGGLALFVGGGTTLFEAVLQNNRAVRGGSLFVKTASFATSIALHAVVAFDSFADYGGGVAVEWGNVTFIEPVLTGNRAVYNGGGLLLLADAGEASLVGGQIALNNAVRGGGIHALEGALALTDTVFRANTAYLGGGMYSEAAEVTALRTRWLDNDAERNLNGHGGSVYLMDVEATFAGSTFAGSRAGTSGGALYAQDSSVQLVNSVLVFGQAPVGSAIYASGTAFLLTNVTAAGNTSTDITSAALHGIAGTSPSTFQLANSIIYGNSPTAFKVDATSSTSASYSCIQGGHAGPGNIGADPLFSGLAQGNLAPQSGSPVINAGSNALLPLSPSPDVEGLPRVVAGTVDMGAFEVQ